MYVYLSEVSNAVRLLRVTLSWSLGMESIQLTNGNPEGKWKGRAAFSLDNTYVPYSIARYHTVFAFTIPLPTNDRSLREGRKGRYVDGGARKECEYRYFYVEVFNHD